MYVSEPYRSWTQNDSLEVLARLGEEDLMFERTELVVR